MKRTNKMIYQPSHRAEDLYLYTINTGEIYRRYILPTIDTLKKHYKKGAYDPERATMQYYRIATEAGRMYNKELDTAINWSTAERWTAAADMERRYYENIEEV